MAPNQRRVGVIVAVVALVAGCGSSAAQGKPAQIVAAAPQRTIDGGAAAIVVNRFGLQAEGVLDLGRDAVRLTVKEASAPETEVLAVGERTWTRPKGSSTWVLDTSARGLLSLPGELRSGDPRAAVALVRGASNVDPFGGLQVQQTSTVRYDLKVDPQAAATQASTGSKAELTKLAGAVDHTVRIDVYIDGDGRIRRLEIPEDLLSVTPTTRIDGNRITTTIDFLRFGVPPEGLDPPAA